PAAPGEGRAEAGARAVAGGAGDPRPVGRAALCRAYRARIGDTGMIPRGHSTMSWTPAPSSAGSISGGLAKQGLEKDGDTVFIVAWSDGGGGGAGGGCAIGHGDREARLMQQGHIVFPVANGQDRLTRQTQLLAQGGKRPALPCGGVEELQEVWRGGCHDNAGRELGGKRGTERRQPLMWAAEQDLGGRRQRDVEQAADGERRPLTLLLHDPASR